MFKVYSMKQFKILNLNQKFKISHFSIAFLFKDIRYLELYVIYFTTYLTHYIYLPYTIYKRVF